MLIVVVPVPVMNSPSFWTLIVAVPALAWPRVSVELPFCVTVASSTVSTAVPPAEPFLADGDDVGGEVGAALDVDR